MSRRDSRQGGRQYHEVRLSAASAEHVNQWLTPLVSAVMLKPPNCDRMCEVYDGQASGEEVQQIGSEREHGWRSRFGWNNTASVWVRCVALERLSSRPLDIDNSVCSVKRHD